MVKRESGFAVLLGCVLAFSSTRVEARDCPHVDTLPPEATVGSFLRARLGGERLQRSATDQEDGSGESPVPLDDASRLYSRFRLHFDYKAYEADPGAAPLWSEGEDADATWPGECDQRYRGVVRYHFQVEADVLSGVLVGPLYPTVPTRAESGSKWRHEAWQPAVDGGLFDPRMLSFGWLTPVGLLQVGLQTSQFGLGVLANSGDEEEERLLFDRRTGGDRVWRALFATRPFGALQSASWQEDLYLALAADLVWRDDFASWLDGDRAYQVVASLFYRGDESFVGTYLARRMQRDAQGTRLDVTAVDGSFKVPFFQGHDTLSASLGGEAVWLTGETDRVYPANGERAVTRVDGKGLALEFEGYHLPTMLGSGVLAGVASGDGDLDDDTLYRFRFDPNYKVGLILFDHYLPAVTRIYRERAMNLDVLGQAPRGVDNLVNDGAVENAYYINPQLSLGKKKRGALLGLGALIAWSPQPWADPYATTENGGQPTGLNGRTTGLTKLGWEVDASLQYRFSLANDALWLAVRGEGGVFEAGEAFRGVVESAELRERFTLVRGRVDLEW